jgi:hypothetical protein
VRALLVVSLGLIACGGFQDPVELAPEVDSSAGEDAEQQIDPDVIAYFVDPTCQPTEHLLNGAAAGFAMLQDVGVTVVESDQPEGAVSVCFSASQPLRQSWSRCSDGGWSYGQGASAWGEKPWIWIWDGNGGHTLEAIAAHELAHVYLRSDQHLPGAEHGIMAASPLAFTWDWSPADVVLLAALGVTLEEE